MSEARDRITISTIRAYEAKGTQPEPGTYRVLVDRLWPRGIAKADLHLHRWDKEIAPSTELRKEFHEGRLSFREFEKRYVLQLRDSAPLQELLDVLRSETPQRIELVYSVKASEQNNATVLRKVLLEDHM